MATYPTYTQINNGDTNTVVPVMANLNAIVTFINTYLVHLDGAKAMTAQLSSNGADPSGVNDYTRKSYVDAVFATETAARVAGDKAKTRVGWGVRKTGAHAYSGASNIDAVSFDTEDWDSDGFFAPTSTNITVPAGRGGIYMVYGEVPQTNGTSGLGAEHWAFYLYLNGGQFCQFVNEDGHTWVRSGSTVFTNLGTCLIALAAGDVVTFRIQNSATLSPNGTMTFVGARLSA